MFIDYKKLSKPLSNRAMEELLTQIREGREEMQKQNSVSRAREREAAKNFQDTPENDQWEQFMDQTCGGI